MATVFETEVCSRCGGTGHYSFNGEHSRCYKCDGRNGARALTKRGKAAQAWFLDQVSKRADAFAVGDVVRMSTGLENITSIESFETGARVNGVPMTNLKFTVTGEAGGFKAHKSKPLSFHDDEGREAMKRAALAYQETLTKAGTPRKR